MHHTKIAAFAVIAGLTASAAFASPGDGTSSPTSSHGASMTLDEAFTMELGNDCRFNARIRGQLVAAKSTPSEPSKVLPDLVINADVQCTDRAALLLTETVQSERPMTLAEVERAVEERARLTSPTEAYGCTYSPDFNLSGAGLNLRAVSYRCPTS